MIRRIIFLGKLYSELNKSHKNLLFKYFIIINLVMILIISVLGNRLHVMKDAEYDWIYSRIDAKPPSDSELSHLNGMSIVDTTVFMMRMSDINLKEKSLMLNAVLNLDYYESHFSGASPAIGIFNGQLIDQQQISRSVRNGRVHEVIKILAEVNPYYMTNMYPFDLELISLRLSPKVEDDLYYFRLNDLVDLTYVAQNDYNLVKMGVVNEVESNDFSSLTDNEHKLSYFGLNRAYMLFEHKNIYSYLKTFQYMLLAVSIALFALLINARTNSPKNGRVAVIGSSIFALSATVFQINASVKIINSLTVIDLVSFYSGAVIILCFLITVRTLRFLDEDGYPLAKLFDMIMFSVIFLYTNLFFIGVYLYA